jgi:hypothetical protein
MFFGIAAWDLPAQDGEKEHHPHMNVAVAVLQDARIELQAAKHDFGGQRKKSLAAVDAASKAMTMALQKANDYRPLTFIRKYREEMLKKYADHPHIRNALHELKQAHTELKDAKHGFGGLREEALRDVNAAI